MEARVKEYVVINILDEDTMLKGRHEACKGAFFQIIQKLSETYLPDNGRNPVLEIYH